MDEQSQIEEPMQWFPLRVTYNREMKVKRELDELGARCFVPMRLVKTVVRGKVVRRHVPSVHNLVFVHCTREWLAEYKSSTRLPVRYIMNREHRTPLVIPDCEMESFIAVAGSGSDDIIYLQDDGRGFERGDRVRIVAGLFKGAEGVLMRIKGDRRVVVSISGLVAVATAFVHPTMLERIG